MSARQPRPPAQDVIAAATTSKARRMARGATPAPAPATAPSARQTRWWRRRWIGRLFWLIPLLAAIAGAGAAATIGSIPDWGRWTLAGIALAGISALGIAVLIGPAARRLAGEHHPLTRAERQQMTATERVQAVNAARHTLIQAATGLVVIGGVVFTAQGLWYTAQSLDASRQAQLTAEEGQITDRYTKAVEQLGSAKLDVRLGGLYALERLAQDSHRDHQTIYDVLAAFVREHDPKPSITDKELFTMRATTDVAAALTIIGRRSATRDVRAPDLNSIRTPGANLSEAYLMDAGLTEARLFRADLTKAHLGGANLTSARLDGANLSGAELDYANLLGANLTDANLFRANLTDAYLTDANLTGANLIDANLTGANLTGANLTGANLTGIIGVTESEIRKVPLVDETTIF
ncbi:pentapeptide repeat-containing protein [Nonomuraea basaltis]|nr:pentapeptide repeat-containing protein [Nonomuraea basaltis]